MRKIYVAEQHDQVLNLWREQEATSLRILHLDFHCDMRGMLIERRSQKAYPVLDFINPSLDEGNFLAHAVLEGRVRSVRWVHDIPGGRQYDVGTVKYETDLTSLPYRLLNAVKGDKGIPIDYRELSYCEWTGLEADEILDIDWDFFACKAYPEDTIQDRVDSFLDMDFHNIPQQIYLSYSPGFCHSSRAQFKRFACDLANIFEAEVVAVQPVPDAVVSMAFYKKYMPSPFLRLIRYLYHSASSGLRKRGIY